MYCRARAGRSAEEKADAKLSQPWTATLSSPHSAVLPWFANSISQLFAQTQSITAALQFILMDPERFLKPYAASSFPKHAPHLPPSFTSTDLTILSPLQPPSSAVSEPLSATRLKLPLLRRMWLEE